MYKSLFTLLLVLISLTTSATERRKLNFNEGWLLMVGDIVHAQNADFDDSRWRPVTLPFAFNGDEAFRKDITDLTDTVCWYRKHFFITENGELRTPSQFSPLSSQFDKLFIEFEGARQGCDVWLNGQKVGFSDNGVMAFGFDLTPYIKEGENVLAVRCDNSWQYRDRVLNSRYQWNDKNFNANYGGLPKNVYLHLTGLLYQTLPLYSSLGTTGTYIYATDIDIAARQAVLHAESEVKNEDTRERTFLLNVVVKDVDGNEVAAFSSERPTTLKPGETAVACAEKVVGGLHFWSWGYGYLYTVETFLTENLELRTERPLVTENGELRTERPLVTENGEVRTERYDQSHSSERIDSKSNPIFHLSSFTSQPSTTSQFSPLTSQLDRVVTRTGFRKTEFRDGMFRLNDRVMMIHGYAQRTSNEWPGVGLSVPAWLSDYSNGLMVQSGGNLVRWMHVAPWKQDVESCDRVGLLQAMPAGDAEKDVEGARWQQRTQLMRDAIIYNRNNPSVVFYECGNFRISKAHMEEMKQIRDHYDPHGGRAIGSREMLDRPEAEYGGEMLYINKSASKPMWAMEYYRDEGLRKYWDEYSYPYHKEGDGPLYRGAPALDYNHNMDRLACGMVERWHEYWLERPGTGRRVSSGGVKIVFSDTNTHHRGESNYRTSGVVDAMRLPKDAFYAHQVMWDGWVNPEQERTHIVGHWNYLPPTPSQGGRGLGSPADVVKPVYVVSTADSVELFVNGKSQGFGRRSFQWLFTWPGVKYEPGTLKAVGYKAHESYGTYKSYKSYKSYKTHKTHEPYESLEPSSQHTLVSAGKPHHLKLTAIENPQGFKADGADMALVEVEVVDKEGRRCPLDNSLVHFALWGEARWIGGIATRDNSQLSVSNGHHPALNPPSKNDPSLLDSADKKNLSDNYVGAMSLPVECGVNRVLVRSTTTAGEVWLSVVADGLRPAYLKLNTQPKAPADVLPAMTLRPVLDRGETPATPSYTDVYKTVDIVGIKAGSNAADAGNSTDDNELTEWKSDGERDNAWITYQLAEKAAVCELTLKLTGWRQKCYPLEVYAGKKKVWEGITPATLGYAHITISKPVAARELTIRMVAPAQNSSKFGQVKELAGGVANEMDRMKTAKGKTELRIVEADLLKKW